MGQTAEPDSTDVNTTDRTRQLLESMRRAAPREVARQLRDEPDELIVDVLENLRPPKALAILAQFKAPRAATIRAAVDEDHRNQWALNERFPVGTIGNAMEQPEGICPPEMTVRETVEQLRDQVKTAFITYIYVTDPQGRLLGLVVMREMLLAKPETKLSEIMLTDVFSLAPDMPIQEAMHEAVGKQFPVYPVCEADGKLCGLLRGDELFERNMYRLIVQAGSMVGVEREERISTPWPRALRLRHMWLLVNLITAFVAGGVVSLFSDTIDKIVVLAAFLPVLAGQSGNTGCQALAVTMRGLALGDFMERKVSSVVAKEALLGILNGASIGLIAAVVMVIYATSNNAAQPYLLGVVIWAAMTGSCLASGVTGALVPVVLKKLGADPATASSIFLTTATDVVSMGLMLSLARVLVL